MVAQAQEVSMAEKKSQADKAQRQPVPSIQDVNAFDASIATSHSVRMGDVAPEIQAAKS